MPMFVPSIFRHAQTTASTTWTMAHNLAGNGSLGVPVVDVFVDVGGVLTKILPSSIEATDANTVVANFSLPYSGIATIIV